MARLIEVTISDAGVRVGTGQSRRASEQPSTSQSRYGEWTKEATRLLDGATWDVEAQLVLVDALVTLLDLDAGDERTASARYLAETLPVALGFPAARYEFAARR